MAEASVSVEKDQFKCPVCLDLLNSPVTIPCGHSFCMICITGCWNQEDQRGVYSCPQCRTQFRPRPHLCKNVVFAKMVENLRSSKRRATISAGTGDVQSIQQKENHLQEMREVVRTHKLSARKAQEDSARYFAELICSIEKSFSEVIKMIRDQEKAAVSSAEELIQTLEQEIDDLRRRNTELPNTDSRLQRTMSCPPSPDVSRIPAGSYDDIAKSVFLLKKKLEDFCKDEIKRLIPSERVPHTEIISPSEDRVQSPKSGPSAAIAWPPTSPVTAGSPDMANINPWFQPQQLSRPQSNPLIHSKYWNFLD